MQELRIRIPRELNKRYRCICIENALSAPRQTTALIRKFVEIHEKNIEVVKKITQKTE